MKYPQERLMEILKSYNIPFKKGPAKNVAENVIGVCCPFCEENGRTPDRSFHLGIFDSGHFSCWRCETKGNLAFLISKMTGLPYRQIKKELQIIGLNNIDIAKALTQEDAGKGGEKASPPRPDGKLVPLRTGRFPVVDQWCKQRGFSIDTLRQYGVSYCLGGKYSHWLIIPVHDENGNYVGFQAANLVRKTKSKYSFPKGFNAKNYLYNLHNATKEDQIVIVEGITDVWRVGNGAVASFGMKLSNRQRILLIKMNKPLILAWDYDAQAAIAKERLWWEGYGIYIKTIRLPVGYDPDTYCLKFGHNKWQKLIGESIYD